MDYEFESEWIIDEWPEIEDDCELESDEYMEKKSKTMFSFIIEKNATTTPPFSLRMELHSAKDYPHVIRIIICAKSRINNTDYFIDTHQYLTFAKYGMSENIKLPEIAFNQTKEKKALFERVWKKNEIHMYFNVKHWTSLPYSLSKTKIDESSYFWKLTSEYSTCYLNSIISILYNIPEFRNIIYSVPELYKKMGNEKDPKASSDCLLDHTMSIPIKKESSEQKNHPTKNGIKPIRSNSLHFNNSLNRNSNEKIIFPIIQALQRLFAIIKKATKSDFLCKCSTRVLTESFGWPVEALNIQHDAEEFLITFLDKLKERLPPTLQQRFFDLFYGIERSYIIKNSPQEGEQTSISDQQFNIINITNITQCKSLDSGLRYYFNDFNISPNNPSDPTTIIKRSRIIKLPKILTFHICRFNDTQKNNSSFSYSRYLKMANYMATDNNEEIENPSSYMYRLLAAVVHVGSANSGHYYSYVSPTIEPNWVKFDDQTPNVIVNAKEVFLNNFGTSDKSKTLCPTAYVLMYVRLDSIEEVMGMKEPIQPPLKAEEYAKKVVGNYIRAKSKSAQTNKRMISIINKKSLIDALDSGTTMNFKGVCPFYSFALKETENQHEVYQKICRFLHLESPIFRLWKIDQHSFVPRSILTDEKERTISSFPVYSYLYFDDDPNLIIGPVKNFESFNIMFEYVFFFFFDPLRCIKEKTKLIRFKYIMCVHVNKIDKIEDFQAEINRKIRELNLIENLDDDENLNLIYFREEKNSSFIEIKPKLTFQENKIQFGSFVYVQVFTDKKEPDFSIPSVIPNYLNGIDQKSSLEREVESSENLLEEKGTEVSLFETMPSLYKFPLSLTNVYSMFNDSLRFNIFQFGYMNRERFYSIRVPGQMKLVDFKRYLAKVIGDEFKTIHEPNDIGTDIVQIFQAPRLNTPLIVPIQTNKNQTIEIKKLFIKKQPQKNDDDNNEMHSVESQIDDDVYKGIDLIDDIYVQIDHHFVTGYFFKRVSFSVNGIFPTFTFQAMIPYNGYTIEDLFNNIISPKISSFVMNQEDSEYNNSDYQIIRQLIESQNGKDGTNLVYDPKLIRTLNIHSSVIMSHEFSPKAKLSKTDPIRQEIRFEIIPEEQKTSTLIPVSLAAPLLSTVAVGVGQPFMMSIDGTEEEIKERLNSLLEKVLMPEEKESKEGIIKFAFGKSSGEIVSNSKIRELNLKLLGVPESDSAELLTTSLSVIDDDGFSINYNSRQFENSQNEAIALIKEAQKLKYTLFIIIKGLNPIDFFSVEKYFSILKIFDQSA